MCTHNGAAHLEAQLTSILQQELAPVEIVLGDDASTDDTLAIAQRFARRAPFSVSFLRNAERLGSTRNFERTMRACGGDFIALCDQDDVWYSHKLKTLAGALEDPAIGAAFSNGDLLREDAAVPGSLWDSFGLTGRQLRQFRGGDPVGVILRGNKVTGMTLMLRRELLDRILPIPPLWVHDWWLTWMLMLYSRLAACPERLVAYRTHAQQQLGVPRRFLPSVRQRGLRTVLAELNHAARKESAGLLPQIEALLARLEPDRALPPVAAALPRIRRWLEFETMRSDVQHLGMAGRMRATAAHWSAYPAFSMRPGKDRLIDLLAVGSP